MRMMCFNLMMLFFLALGVGLKAQQASPTLPYKSDAEKKAWIQANPAEYQRLVGQKPQSDAPPADHPKDVRKAKTALNPSDGLTDARYQTLNGSEAVSKQAAHTKTQADWEKAEAERQARIDAQNAQRVSEEKVAKQAAADRSAMEYEKAKIARLAAENAKASSSVQPVAGRTDLQVNQGSDSQIVIGVSEITMDDYRNASPEKKAYIDGHPAEFKIINK